MLRFLTIVFLLCPLLNLSQGELVDFKLKKAKSCVKISPDIDILFEGTKNYLKLEALGELEIVDTTAFGEISSESGFLVLEVNSLVNDTETLRVYAKNKHTKAEEVFEKKYKIIPLPKVHISGVENDSALQRNLILLSGKLELKSILPNLDLQVDSFKMELIQNGIVFNFVSQSEGLTREMRKRIWEIQEGNSLLFYDIYTSYTKGMSVSLAPTRIYTFIDNTRPTKLSTGSGIVIRR